MKCVLSLRGVLACAGAASVLLCGSVTWGITWNSAVNSIEPIAAALEDGLLQHFASVMSDVEDNVQQLASRGGRLLDETNSIGCCSAAEDNAKYVTDFFNVRQLLWESVAFSDRVQMSLVGTMSGSLLGCEVTDDMADIDGTQARNQQGNLRWALSDASTNYTLQGYLSNTFYDEPFFNSVSSSCLSGSSITNYHVNVAAIISQSQCDSAAAALNFLQNSTAISDSGKILGCFVSNGLVYWNPSGDANKFDSTKTALCSQDAWLKRDQIFEPNCTDPWPCTQGAFVPVLNPGFDRSRSTTSKSHYNATMRSWYTDAMKSGNLSGPFCQRVSDCRSRATWGGIFRDVADGTLRLPAVYPVYVGRTDTLRAVLALVHRLDYLDGFINELLERVCSDASAWIIDMKSSSRGTLIASSPTVLHTAGGTSLAAMDGQVTILATSFAALGPMGARIQDVSIALVNRYGGWESIPQSSKFTYKDVDLVQAIRLSDEYLLDWLLVLSIPQSFFYKDLPKLRDVSIGVMCGIGILMAIFFFSISYMVTRNLITLGLRMKEVADLKLDRVDDKRISILSEVITMEMSFKTMAGRLNELWRAEALRMEKLQREHERRQSDRVIESVRASTDLRHPMVLCRVSRFIELGALISYEVLRDTGHLIVLDTMKKVWDFVEVNFIVFISHQWLGWGTPDPDNIHHRCMCKAIMEVQKQEYEKGHRVEIDKMYVWVDFCSISQEHRGMQMLAISSLTVYSAVSHAFVIVAPTAFHKNSSTRCDLGTYNTRGWCRAETLSKICASGFENMYMMTSIDGSLVPYTMEDLTNDTCSIFVFEGVFSCCCMGHKDQLRCDKQHLAEPALGLYYLALERLQGQDPLLVYLKDNKRRLYPETFKFFIEPDEDSEVRKFEERELFGNLVELLEEYRREV